MSQAIVHDVERVARAAPSDPAVSWRGSVWTYGELQGAIECVMSRLAAEGLVAGARVALLLRNSPQYVATLYGAMAAECIAVPLNVQEHASVILRQLEHVQCNVLVVDSEHPEWSAISDGLHETVRVIELTLRSDSEAYRDFCAVMGPRSGHRAAAPSTADPAVVIYTSGTTANPKGVTLSHGNLSANAHAIAEYLGIDSNDKVLSVLPFHFSYGNSVLNSNLIAGAHILIEDNLAFPHVTLRRIQDEKVTGFPGVPSTFALLLGRCSIGQYDLSRLRYVTQAGGPMPRAHVEQLRSLLPHVRTFIMYGQTEATARLTYLPPDKLDERMGSVGLPLRDVEIQVRADGRVVSAGEVGEICARGPNVMLGYWRDPALSAEVLRDGWLHTGDLGHFDDDGYLFIDGRAQEMIKVGAFRVSPPEIEEVLSECDGVEQAAVVAIPDELLGQAVKAILVLRPGAEADTRSVKAHCRQRLASYKIPKVVEFAASLPRTSSGKIQRFKLV